MTESVNMKATGSGTLPELHCAICAQASHGCHFGVVACRPCAAFFRFNLKFIYSKIKNI